MLRVIGVLSIIGGARNRLRQSRQEDVAAGVQCSLADRDRQKPRTG